MIIPFLNNCVASFGETYKKLQLFIIVNSKNKWTFINPGLGTDNSDLREVSKVPLTRLSPLIRGARGVGDLAGWGFRGLVVYWECLINSGLREVSKVPLTRLSPLLLSPDVSGIRGARGVGDLAGWGFRELVVYWECLINSKIYRNYPMN